MQLLMQYQYWIVSVTIWGVWLHCFCHTILPGLRVPAFPSLAIANNL